ncbi:MAG: hypothetical protein U0694_22070 [Anaerolineae bacterium]
MVWLAAGFLGLIYLLLSLLRRRFSIPLTPNLWAVIMLSLFFGTLVYLVPRVIAAHADDSRLDSALYISNSAGMGIMLCGSLLGCIAQAAHEWGAARRERKRQQQAAKSQSD